MKVDYQESFKRFITGFLLSLLAVALYILYFAANVSLG